MGREQEFLWDVPTERPQPSPLLPSSLPNCSSAEWHQPPFLTPLPAGWKEANAPHLFSHFPSKSVQDLPADTVQSAWTPEHSSSPQGLYLPLHLTFACSGSADNTCLSKSLRTVSFGFPVATQLRDITTVSLSNSTKPTCGSVSKLCSSLVFMKCDQVVTHREDE